MYIYIYIWNQGSSYLMYTGNWELGSKYIGNWKMRGLPFGGGILDVSAALKLDTPRED